MTKRAKSWRRVKFWHIRADSALIRWGWLDGKLFHCPDVRQFDWDKWIPIWDNNGAGVKHFRHKKDAEKWLESDTQLKIRFK